MTGFGEVLHGDVRERLKLQLRFQVGWSGHLLRWGRLQKDIWGWLEVEYVLDLESVKYLSYIGGARYAVGYTSLAF